MREAQRKRAENVGVGNSKKKKRIKQKLQRLLRRRAKGTVKHIILYPAFVPSASVDKSLDSGHVSTAEEHLGSLGTRTGEEGVCKNGTKPLSKVLPWRSTKIVRMVTVIGEA